MLIGIVKKNAIMMIDFAIEAQHATAAEDSPRRSRRSSRRASVSFRPIMMTTMAALDGRAPDRSRVGRGRRRVVRSAWPLSAGLAFSQLITLYVTPVFYTYLGFEWQQSMSRRKARREQTAGISVAPPLSVPLHSDQS